MGRPLKIGLDFFSTDIDMDEDDKLIDLLEDIGTIEGTGVVWHLLNAIYKSGYFLEWNDSILKKLCRRKQLDKTLMESGIKYLTGQNMTYSQRLENPTFFDYEIFKTYKVLTSRGLQKRYLIASGRRAKILFDQRFILLDYFEETRPYKKRFEKDPVDVKGYWTELDTKFYLINFITNGLLCDNIKEDNVDTNRVCVDTNTLESENVQNKDICVDTSAQIEKKETGKRNRKEIEIEIEKDSNIINMPTASKNPTMYKIIESIFLSKNNDNFDNYKKEGMAIKGIIAKAEKRDNTETFIQELIEKFYDLTINGNDFWKGQPFLPSALNASGIFARVEKQIQASEFIPNEPDYENMAKYDEIIF